MHHAWKTLVIQKAEDFFGEDLSKVCIEASLEPERHVAVGMTHADRILVDPFLFGSVSKFSLQVIGHELAHVMQQRTGRVSRNEAGILADRLLEAEADLIGDSFYRFCIGDLGRARPRPISPGTRSPSARDVVQLKVWAPSMDVLPNDELFWHCTTLPSVKALYQAEKIDITRGDGWQGKGFYVTTAMADYPKIMALRNHQTDAKPYLFALYILVKDFYNMEGVFQDGRRFPGRLRAPR